MGEVIKQLKSIRPSPTQLRKDSEINFVDVEDKISKIYDLIDVLDSDLKKWLPQEKQAALETTLTELLGYLTQIRDFSLIADGDPMSRRNALATQVNRIYGVLFEWTSPLYALQTAKDASKASVRENASTIKNLADESKKKAKELDEVISSVRKASGEKSIASFADFFGKESARYKTQADSWFKRVIGSLIILGIVIIILFVVVDFLIKPPVDTGLATQLVLLKLASLSVVFYVLYQCIKNYNVNNHLEVSNKHRENSLRTFEALKNGSSDLDTQKAVLLAATSAIFSLGDTGYINQKDAEPGNIAGLIETFFKK